MSQRIEYLMIHCTATPEGRDLQAQDIIRMHCSPVSKGGRGWKVPGYSVLILLGGTLATLVPYDGDDIIQPREITNGAVGLNGKTRHIAYVGGLDKLGAPKDTRTDEQETALKNYVYDFLVLHPRAKVLGHNQAPGVKKACPSFNVPKWLMAIGVNKSNIYV